MMHPTYRLDQTACFRIAVVTILTVHVGLAVQALDFPSLAALSDSALDEMRKEDKVSEVLGNDVNYRSLFNSISNPDIPLRNYVAPGEELTFQANWNGFPAGSVRLEAKRVVKLKNRPVFVFELNLESNDFMSAFYPISTSINSYVDADNGRSYLIRRRVSEKKRAYKDRLEFKYDFRLPNGLPDPVSRYSQTGENGQEVAGTPFPIPGNMQDMISIIYSIRGMNLHKTGDSCMMLVGGRKRPTIATVTVIGEEQVSIPGIGKFDCLVVKPVTDGTNLSGSLIATRGAEKVWLEKNSHVPVMVSAELPIGSVIATLTQAENSPLLRNAVQ